jgi:hypothetical protein
MAQYVVSRRFVGFLLFVILAVHAWAIITSAYFNIWWLDIVMHFSGGFWVGLLGLLLIRGNSYPDPIFFWLVLGLATIIGVGWEFMEFSLNHLFENLGREGFFQPSIEDVLGDLLADMLGGTTAFILFKEREKKL